MSILYGVAPGLRERINEPAIELKDRALEYISPELNPLSPTSARSSTSSLSGHEPRLAIDGGVNTVWQADGNQELPTLTVTFGDPVRIDQLIVRNGSADGFKDTQRPSVLLFIYDSGGTATVELGDFPDPQTIDIEDGKDVTSVDIQILDVYPSLDSSDVSVSEIEFFGR